MKNNRIIELIPSERWVRLGDMQWRLSETEYKMVDAIKNAKHKLSRQQLGLLVWHDAAVCEKLFGSHIESIRSKVPPLNIFIEETSDGDFRWKTQS